jgi:hypothetical protein
MSDNEKEDAVVQAAIALGLHTMWIVRESPVVCYYVHAVDEADAIKVARQMSSFPNCKFAVERYR